MKKHKSLSKRIERLKGRLQKDAKKLAKLTMKLGAAIQGKGGRKGKKSERPAKVEKPSKAAAPTPAPEKKKNRASSAAREVAKPTAPTQTPAPTPKAKKKMNLTPERRAQLAAAMKARWAAKKAAARTESKATAGGAANSSA